MPLTAAVSGVCGTNKHLNLEIIPLPLLLPNGTGPIFQSEVERRSSRQTLDALDREALADPNSKFVRKTLHELATAISAPGGTEL